MAMVRKKGGGLGSLQWCLFVLAIASLLDQIRLLQAADPDPMQDYCVAEFNVGGNNVVNMNGYPCKDRALVTSDDFAYSGLRYKGDTAKTGTDAIITFALVHDYPGLNTHGISHVRLDFEPGGVIPLHTHPLASETLFVLEGSVFTGFVSHDNKLFAKKLQKGDLFLFPRATQHFQLNVGNGPASTFNSFNAQNPGLLLTANQLLATNISHSVLSKSFGVSEAAMAALTASLPRYWG